MSLFRIRPAVPSDVPAVQSLLATTWHHTYDGILGIDKVAELTREWHTLTLLKAELEREDHLLLVAEQGADIVGTLSATLRGEMLRVERLYVLPMEQRRGIGQSLLDAAADWFPQARLVRLAVHPRNAVAIGFYRRRGFTVDAAAQPTDDAVILSRPLSRAVAV